MIEYELADFLKYVERYLILKKHDQLRSEGMYNIRPGAIYEQFLYLSGLIFAPELFIESHAVSTNIRDVANRINK